MCLFYLPRNYMSLEHLQNFIVSCSIGNIATFCMKTNFSKLSFLFGFVTYLYKAENLG